MSLEATIEEITPEMAKEYLSKNKTNRPIRRALVAGYIRDMTDGRWHLTHQGIAFDEEGNLLDGQHRLHAIMGSGTTQHMVVTRSVPSDSMPVLDSGAKRTVSDYLGLSGVTNRTVVAAIARLAMLYDKDILNTSARNVTTNAEIEEYYQEYPKELERAAELTMEFRSYIPTLSSALGTAILMFNRVDPEACLQFFDAIVKQQTRGEGDPRLALSRRLQSIKTDKRRVNQVQILDLFIRAWNAWREEKDLAMIPLADKIKIRKVL